jgi:hypothetical protein
MGRIGALVWLGVAAQANAWAQASPDMAITYKCPGNTYTNLITAQEAKSRNCTTIEGAPITIVQGAKPKPAAASAPRPPGAERISPTAQRERDSDARRILEAELKREQERLDSLQKEYNNGEPERRGDERNYGKYQERVAEMKAGIARKEGDIAAIKRELAKLPPPQ